MLFYSCKKEQKAPPVKEVKTYNVKFSLSDFSQTVTPGGIKGLSLSTNAASNIPASVDIISYIVTTTQDVLVSQITQDRTNPNFGTITDKLPAGRYKIRFFGGATAYEAGVSEITQRNWDQPGETSPANAKFWQDSFALLDTIAVTTADVVQNVSLHRIVGQLTVKLNDAIPANANRITIQVDKDVNLYSWKYDGPKPPIVNTFIKSKTTILTPADIGATNFTRSYMILNTDVKHNVNISCYDAANKLIAQAVVNNIDIKRNTNTILSGNLFGADGTFTISLNQAWGTPINVDF